MKWVLLLAVFFAGCGHHAGPAAGSGKLTLFGTYTSVTPFAPNLTDYWNLKSTGEYSKETRNAEGRPVILETGDFALENNWFSYTPRRVTSYRKGVVRRVMEVKDEHYTVLVKQEGDKIILDPENSTLLGRQVLTPTN